MDPCGNIVPIVIEESDDAQLSTVFGQIITVISALGMSDERIIEEFKTLVSGRREPGRIVEIDIPKTVTNINFQA